MKLLILFNTTQRPDVPIQTAVITLDELKRWVLSGAIVNHFFRYEEVHLLTYRIDFIPKPFFIALLLRLLSFGDCSVKDDQGQIRSITIRALVELLLKFQKDFFKKSGLIKRVNNEVNLLFDLFNDRQKQRTLYLSSAPVYMRTDLWFGVQSGGSVGHIAGVLNNMDKFTGNPVFLTTDVIPTVRDDIETHYIYPEHNFLDFIELPSIFFNETFENNARDILNDKRISFIYQRYSLNNYSGLKLSEHYGIPFVLEYNGSEIWISRHWGKPLKYESLSERIEMLNLQNADLIVVVSQTMKEELTKRGISKDKVLVDPNGVDPEKYSTDIDGSQVRQQ